MFQAYKELAPADARIAAELDKLVGKINSGEELRFKQPYEASKESVSTSVQAKRFVQYHRV